jgi:hypothetical protein
MEFLNDFGFEFFEASVGFFGKEIGKEIEEGWSDRLTSTSILKDIVLSSKENLQNSIK